MPDVIVVGGSNSLLGKGWTSHLQQACGGAMPFRNLSIGAATSLMGIYRMMRGEIPDGATIIWEYALNESNHLRAGQSCESLAHHLDWFMETARRRNIRVLPLQFWNRPEMPGDAPNSYRLMLRKRLSAHGLCQIDARELSASFANDRNFPMDDLYMDDMHYAVDTGFLAELAHVVVERLEDAAVPRPVDRLQDATLELCLPEGPSVLFENSVFRAESWPLDRTRTIAARGDLLASFVIAGNEAGAMTLSADGKTIGCWSLQAAGVKPGGRILKHIVHWSTTDDLHRIRDGLMLSGQRPLARPIVQNMYKWSESCADEPRGDAYLCALVERPS